MPYFRFKYVGSEGPGAAEYQLDSEAPLRRQIIQIVEDMQVGGVVLAGAPDDELGVFLEGRELDQTRTPRELALHEQWTLELRMRPRPVVRAAESVVAESYFPKASYAAMLLGALAGSITWGVGLLLTDLTVLPSVEAIDLAIGVLFATLVSTFVNGFESFRRFERVAPAAFLGAIVGALSGGIGISLALAIRDIVGEDPPFAAAFASRIAAWACLALFLQLGLAVLRRRTSLLTARLVIAVGAGAACAIIFNFKGPTMLWQGLALMALGSAIGFAVTGTQLWHTRAIVDVEAADRRAVGVLGARGLALVTGVPVPLRPVTRWGAPAGQAVARLLYDGEKVTVSAPPETRVRGGMEARVSGEPLSGSVTLGDGDTIDVEGTRYRLHVVSTGSAA